MSTFAIVVCSVLRYDWQWSQANRTQCRFAGTLYGAVHDRVAKNRRRFFIFYFIYFGKAMFGRLSVMSTQRKEEVNRIQKPPSCCRCSISPSAGCITRSFCGMASSSLIMSWILQFSSWRGWWRVSVGTGEWRDSNKSMKLGRYHLLRLFCGALCAVTSYCMVELWQHPFSSLLFIPLPQRK